MPAENGDADRLTIASAPGANQLLDRIVVVAAPLPEVAVVPDVLADADAEPPAADVEDLRAVERLEVAVLVEDVVGGQQRLAEALLDACRRAGAPRVLKSGRPSSDGFGSGRPTSVGGSPSSSRASACELVPARVDEAVAEQQIARQVADERELRRDREVGAARAPPRGRRRQSAARCRRDRRPSG